MVEPQSALLLRKQLAGKSNNSLINLSLISLFKFEVLKSEEQELCIVQLKSFDGVFKINLVS